MSKIKVSDKSKSRKINVRVVKAHRVTVGHSLFISTKSLEKFNKLMGRA